MIMTYHTLIDRNSCSKMELPKAGSNAYKRLWIRRYNSLQWPVRNTGAPDALHHLAIERNRLNAICVLYGSHSTLQIRLSAHRWL